MLHFCILILGVFYRLYKGGIFAMQENGLLEILFKVDTVAIILDCVESVLSIIGLTVNLSCP